MPSVNNPRNPRYHPDQSLTLDGRTFLVYRDAATGAIRRLKERKRLASGTIRNLEVWNAKYDPVPTRLCLVRALFDLANHQPTRPT
ncbi:hypothetical protein Kuura_042 [Caulobacter phage Kuura]|nr:hypothetical protein Kuura_042 [Caulobacter phage Kuura]